MKHEFAFDILGLGCVAVDDLIYVASYPPPDAKVPVQGRERHCGGLTGTALVAASRLGSRCAYAGVLGNDDLSRFVIERLKLEDIDVTHLVRHTGACPIHSTVIVDESRHTRTLFCDLDGGMGADVEAPAPEVIRSARALFVDHVGIERTVRAARVARAAAIPVVADLESDESTQFGELLALVDHLILAHDFAQRLTGASDAAAAANALWTEEREAVVITCGEEGCWYLARSYPSPQHQPAFSVKVVDTTGCGDVFHGAYASALVRGLDLAERVRFASAAAALKATRRGGQAGIPNRSEVEALLGRCR